jgi:DNA-binding FrmR family transcriptional regulator
MKRLAIALLTLSIALPLMAWTRAADQRIAAKSAELAPPDLKLIIDKYHNEYLAGVDEALASEGTDIHRRKLRERIEGQTRSIVKMIHSNEPMSAVVRQLAVLAHLAGDANNPFHIGDDNAEEHADFEKYFERRLARFAPVFYGLDRNFVLNTYLDKMFARTTRLSPLMAEEYSRGNGATFDDRSTAFGVASVCYSHAITDTVNLYYFVWKAAGGSLRGPLHPHAN